MIAKCTCHNEYQDNHYGNGNRVFNKGKKEGTGCCTACGKGINISPPRKKDTEQKKDNKINDKKKK